MIGRYTIEDVVTGKEITMNPQDYKPYINFNPQTNAAKILVALFQREYQFSPTKTSLKVECQC